MTKYGLALTLNFNQVGRDADELFPLQCGTYSAVLHKVCGHSLLNWYSRFNFKSRLKRPGVVQCDSVLLHFIRLLCAGDSSPGDIRAHTGIPSWDQVSVQVSHRLPLACLINMSVRTGDKIVVVFFRYNVFQYGFVAFAALTLVYYLAFVSLFL